MTQNWRLFIAIELPDDILRQIAHVQQQIGRQIPARAVRWVKPNSIHLTLKFLGDVEKDRIDSLKSALDEAAANHVPFSLEVAAPGCFPNTRNPRVLWLGLEGDLESLDALQRSIEEGMTGLGFEPENRGFSPHLTLARVQRNTSRDNASRVGLAAERGLAEPVGGWQVESLSLMRSQLKPSGSIYTELHRAQLGDG
jgi:2'-5' RNA ligase